MRRLPCKLTTYLRPVARGKENWGEQDTSSLRKKFERVNPETWVCCNRSKNAISMDWIAGIWNKPEPNNQELKKEVSGRHLKAISIDIPQIFPLWNYPGRDYYGNTVFREEPWISIWIWGVTKVVSQTRRKNLLGICLNGPEWLTHSAHTLKVPSFVWNSHTSRKHYLCEFM